MRKKSPVCQLLANLLADESGQALTEYVLLVSVLASIILGLAVAFQKKLRALLEGNLGNYLTQQMFSPDNLHRFRPIGGFRN